MRGQRGFTYLELLCVTAIAATVWILLVPALVRARNRADEASCAAQLRNIGWALRMYAQDHSGQLPPELTGLTPRYLEDVAVYRCPSAVVVEKRYPQLFEPAPLGTVDYVYVAGLAIDDRPGFEVVWDNAARHGGKANVLYLSSRVEKLDPMDLPGLAKEEEARP